MLKIDFDFCMVGMTTVDADGNEVPAKKRTGIVTNSEAIASILRRAQCDGSHRHEQLLGWRASKAQIYPDKFCRRVCEGIKQELQRDRWRNEMLKANNITEEFNCLMKLESMAMAPEEAPGIEHLYEGQEFIDDISGALLDKAQAVAARKLEMDFFRRMKVYEKVPRSQARGNVVSTNG